MLALVRRKRSKTMLPHRKLLPEYLGCTGPHRYPLPQSISPDSANFSRGEGGGKRPLGVSIPKISPLPLRTKTGRRLRGIVSVLLTTTLTMGENAPIAFKLRASPVLHQCSFFAKVQRRGGGVSTSKRGASTKGTRAMESDHPHDECWHSVQKNRTFFFQRKSSTGSLLKIFNPAMHVGLSFIVFF